MTHVLVPCPEEYVPELTMGLIRLSMGMGGWDDDMIGRFVADLDELGRSLVLAVARAAEERDRVPYRKAASLLGVEVGDVLDLVTQINERCRAAGMPLPLITETFADEGADGSTSITAAVVIVRPVALRVLDQLGVGRSSAPVDG